MKKLLFATVVTIAFLIAGSAQAQTCSEITTASKLADKGFPVSTSLSGADRCAIEHRESQFGKSSGLYCHYTFQTEASAISGAQSFYETMKSCLPEWEASEFGESAFQMELDYAEIVRWVDISQPEENEIKISIRSLRSE